MKKSVARQISYYGLFVSLAFIFNYVEVIIPFSMIIPGIKLGLANIVVLTAMYAFGSRDAFIISMVRIVLVAITFSNTFTMIYSIAGGLLSWLIMSLFKKTNKFSMIGVSVAGGVAHNIGQLIVAAILMETISLIYYLPILIVGGIVTGIIIGWLGRSILKILRRHDSQNF